MPIQLNIVRHKIKINMRRLIVFLVLLANLGISIATEAGEPNQTDAQKDELLRKRIVGKWSEGNYPFGVSHFKKGGAYEAWIYENPEMQKRLFTMKGKWWIEKGRLYNKLEEITPSFPAMKPGEISTDTIVDISKDVMTLIDEKGKQYQKKRME